MNNLKIMLLSAGTGGGEMFNVLYNDLTKYLKLNIQNIQNISLTNTAKRVNKQSTLLQEKEVYTLIDKFCPNVIIYETSNICPLMIEILSKYKNKIYLVSIMDVYDETNRRFKNLIPNLICTPTQSIYNQMKNYGYDNLFLFTNPTILELNKYEYNKKPFNNNSKIKILLTSQGVNKEYREKTNEIIEVINNSFENYSLTIKLHPEELNINTLILNNKCNILYDNPCETIEDLLLSYDLVIGVNSTLQLKSYLLNIPTIFYEDMYNDINNFKENKTLCTNFKYKDFIDCKDFFLYKKRLKTLLNIIKDNIF